MPLSKLVVASPEAAHCAAIGRILDLFPARTIWSFDRISHTFRSPDDVFDRLESLTPCELRDAVAIIDFSGVELEPWNTRQMGRDSRGLGAQLFVSFPEVFFIFVACPPPACCLGKLDTSDLSGNQHSMPPSETELHQGVRDVILRHHFVRWTELFRLFGLLEAHRLGFRTIFDPSGLRNCLKRELLSNTQRGDYYKRSIQLRLKQSAMVAEEEPQFIHLNGYAAYRAGFATWLATSGREFERILPPLIADRVHGPKLLDLVLSDWQLAFADYEGMDEHDQLLCKRELRAEEAVLVVTSFAGDPKLENFISTTNQRRNSQTTSTASAKLIKSAPKPYAGIHDLLRQIKSSGAKVLEHEPIPKNDNRPEDTSTAGAKVLEHEPIPKNDNRPEHTSTKHKHDLPFARRQVANRLLSRALRISNESSVEDQVHRATLALDAKELLGGLSLNTYYDSLALQHESEVNGELACSGIVSQLVAEDRISEMNLEAGAVMSALPSQVVEQSVGTSSKLNFLSQTANRLRLRYAAREQVTAAEHCLVAFADLQHQIEAKKSVSSWIRSKASRYVDYVTKSGTRISRLLWCNLVLVVFFGLCYAGILVYDGAAPLSAHTIGYGWGMSLFTFFELQPGIGEVEPALLSHARSDSIIFVYRLVLLAELVFAYINLGLLVSMLYRRLTKHAP